MFVDTLTPDHKNYLLNRDNLTQPIHMQLSQKVQFVLIFLVFFAFLKPILNFKHFPKTDDPDS